ncbi:MAG TPA: alpha-E domain-containing protein [Chthoniobacterales bacterium]
MLSRVADSCFWLSRYIERAETNARLLDVNRQLLLDFEDQESEGSRNYWTPILATLQDQEMFGKLYDRVDADSVLEYVTFEKKNPNSIVSCISAARENARTIREQISSEMWEQLNKVYLYLKSPAARSDYQQTPSDFYRSLMEGSHLFAGITDATMTHGEGWLFLQAGKYLERADSTSRVLDIKYHLLLPRGEQVGGNVDITQWIAVLRSCSAREAYLKIYEGQVTVAGVVEFLTLNASFPRSIRFSVDHVDRILHRISGQSTLSFTNDAERLSGLLRSSIDYAQIGPILETGLHQYLDHVQQRLSEIAGALAKTYCEWLEETPAD